jgi:hypothetical protein
LRLLFTAANGDDAGVFEGLEDGIVGGEIGDELVVARGIGGACFCCGDVTKKR